MEEYWTVMIYNSSKNIPKRIAAVSSANELWTKYFGQVNIFHRFLKQCKIESKILLAHESI